MVAKTQITPAVKAGNVIPAALVTKANAFGETAWKNFNETRKLEISLGAQILALAQEAKDYVDSLIKDGKASTSIERQFSLAKDVFVSMCNMAVLHVTTTHPNADVKELKEFSTRVGRYTTNIKRGVGAGLDPRRFKSETAFRNAIADSSTPQAGNSGGDNSATNGLDDAQKKQVKEVHQSVIAVTKAGSDKIAQATATLLSTLKALNISSGDANEEKALALLNNCVKQLVKMVPKQPKQPQQAKPVQQEAQAA